MVELQLPDPAGIEPELPGQGRPGIGHCSPSVLQQIITSCQQPTSLSPLHDVLNSTCASFGTISSCDSSARNKLTEEIFCNKGTRPWTALEDLAEKTGRNRRTLADDLNICASALLETSRWNSRIDLYMLMMLSRTDTSNLESLMALIRRLLKSRQQTHGLSMNDLNAAWCLQRQRSKLPDNTGSGSKQLRKRPAAMVDDAEAATAKKLKLATNSWHLHCRQKGHGHHRTLGSGPRP